jgi:N-acetylglucosaminyl-diphospho-decaprenol L-rhamnosyltransferase
MKIFVSVISHGHSELIKKLECLSELSKRLNVVVKSNKPQEYFDDMKANPNFHWLNSNYGLGFGHNNNLVFEYCHKSLGMVSEDYFVVLNPDVIIEANEIFTLVEKMDSNSSKISAINLFKDHDKSIYDNSIRSFPNFYQFAQSFIGLGNSAILDKSKLNTPKYVDWAAGSFLAFKASYYSELNGFDENYFMYCEDIDICYRSHLLGERVLYFPEIKAIHLAMHANRKLVSKHFYWHLKSVIRFLLTKLGLTKNKSSLTNVIDA